MAHGSKTSCVLCQRSEETKTTGALSTKEDITAHQNCLLFSSGLYSTASPEFDDLFGFSVADVKEEVKRGGRLTCKYCGKKGATAGCENGRCKKSFHYPCAQEGESKILEDPDKGHFGLYCSNCKFKNGNSVNVQTKPHSSRNPGEGPSKVSCGNTKGNTARPLSKRRLSFSDEEGNGRPSKQKHKVWKRMISDNSSDTDVNELIPPLESDFAESENSVLHNEPAVPELISKDSETASSVQEKTVEIRDENNDEDEMMIASDAESESLLRPVYECIEPESRAGTSAQVASPERPQVFWAEMGVQTIKREYESSSPAYCPEEHDYGSPVLQQSPVHCPEKCSSGPPVPQQSSTWIAPSPGLANCCSFTASRPCSSSVIAVAPAEPDCMTSSPSPPPPPAPASDPDVESKIDSTSFWKSCNTAGCTRPIFTDFIDGMNEIFSRVQTEQASQEDYDCALSVIMASGRLAEFVARQQEELQRKQTELQKAAEALEAVVSALKK